jgi:hypothetical protein
VNGNPGAKAGRYNELLVVQTGLTRIQTQVGAMFAAANQLVHEVTPKAASAARLSAVGEALEKKVRRGVEKWKKLRVAVWHGNKEMQVARACFPNWKVKLFLRPLEF